MKAWRLLSFGDYSGLKLEEIEDPKPGKGEVLIRVKAAGVNPVDRSMITGRFEFMKLPGTPGAEFCGVIESAGEGSDVKKGMKVAAYPRLFCGRCHYCLRGDETACLSNIYMERAPYILGIIRPGGWAERVVVPEQNVLEIPDGVAFEHAATVPVDGGTALRMVQRARPSINDFMLVMGATGGVGMFAVQFGRLFGCEVAAVASNEEQARTLEGMGASHIIMRSADIPTEIKKLTGGRGADIVIDPLGAATFQSSTMSLAPLGRYVSCGILTGPKAELSITRLYSMQIEYIGSTNMRRYDVMTALSLMSHGRVKAPVDSVYDFPQLKDALTRLDAHGRKGKVILRL